MSRGWESKDVESQQEEAARRESVPELTPAERIRLASRHGLDLEQTRLERELELAAHPRHKELLKAALNHVLGQLAKLK